MTSDDFYLHSDIPPGMTIDEYRQSRPRDPNAGRARLAAMPAIGSRRSSRVDKRPRPARLADAYRRAGTLT